MEIKHLRLDWKADAQGVIEGYGSVSDVVDLGGDAISQGAFANSLGSGRKVKMLWQHRTDKVCGVWDDVTEDANGLRVKGRLLLTVEAGREAHELVKAGAIDGLSIGYRTLKSTMRSNVRVITEAELWEVSLVTFPMNELARVDAVKAAGLSERDFERVLTQDAGFSRSVARKLMAGGIEAVKAMQDAGDGADELAALLTARLAL